MLARKRIGIVFVLVGLLMMGVSPATTYAMNLSEKDLQEFSQNDILYYDPSECVDGVGAFGPSLDASGDFEKILTAKKK